VPLSIPEDIEPFLTDGYEQITEPGCYCLSLSGPHTDWGDVWDSKPPWWERAVSQPCYYVGATGNVRRRLEEHRDGEIRTASLVSICDIDGLEAVAWREHAGEYEHRFGLQMEREHPEAFVHWR
jgi:predicted GIY-YIG superfamily endonuclease